MRPLRHTIPFPMKYRVCKVFEVESGHMLSKHPGRCRFAHGHSRRIEVVVSSETLDANDMVCDFKALKLAVHAIADRLDHAMALNSADSRKSHFEGGRVVLFDGQDPTTEVIAKHLYDELAALVRAGGEFQAEGVTYRLPISLQVERIRVGETSSTWAEYGQ